jgi:anti-sigma B factor antagonist
MNDWDPAFERTEQNGVAVLVVRGEIDLSIATRFAQELDAVLGGAAAPAVVDLGQVGFIDSAGVRELVKAQRRAQEEGADLHLRNPSEACQRVLQLSGLWAEFTVVDTV